MGWGDQNTMGRGVDIPWIGGQYTMGRGVDIPWVGVSIFSLVGGVDIPWIGGLIYHG